VVIRAGRGRRVPKILILRTKIIGKITENL